MNSMMLKNLSNDFIIRLLIWGHSSAGRAPAWHAGGQEFEYIGST